MKLEQLQYFNEVVKYGSISVAADKNFISQPALSAAVSKLEKELECNLLERQNKGVIPTEEGKLILEKIAIILQSISEIEDIAKKKKPVMKMNIAATQSLTDAFLPFVMKRINIDQVPFLISMFVLENHIIYQRVTTGNAHFGIVAYNSQLMNNDLEYHKLFSDEYLLYVGPKSPLWNYSAIPPKELFEQPYIGYGDEFLDEKAEWNKDFFGMKRPNITLRINNTQAIRNMILNDNYVAFFPRFSAKRDHYVINGTIKALPIDGFHLPVQYGCIESRHYRRTSKERLFLEYLKTSVSDLAQ